MRAAAALLLLLSACGDASVPMPEPPLAGAALEAAAVARGLVPDPARLDAAGSYAGDTDAVCVVRADDGYRIGVTADYGEGQRCRAVGSARGRDVLDVDLGGSCRFEARFDGQALAFPATLPGGCARLCSGRATLTALTVTRLSTSAAEAMALRDARGRPLCDS